MHGLVHPLFFTAARVQRQYRRAVFVVQRGTFDTIDVGRRAAHRQEQGVHGWVIGHRRPAVGGAAHVAAVAAWCVTVLGVARVEGPAHLPADDVETADHSAWHVGLDVVGNTPANHHGGTGHQRRR
ncbi:hypothetical protein D3C78_1147490 [compost metagenome]